MSKLDADKERIAYLKLWQSMMLIAGLAMTWLVFTAASAKPLMIFAAMLAATLLAAFKAHVQIRRRFDEPGAK